MKILKDEIRNHLLTILKKHPLVQSNDAISRRTFLDDCGVSDIADEFVITEPPRVFVRNLIRILEDREKQCMERCLSFFLEKLRGDYDIEDADRERVKECILECKNNSKQDSGRKQKIRINPSMISKFNILEEIVHPFQREIDSERRVLSFSFGKYDYDMCLSYILDRLVRILSGEDSESAGGLDDWPPELKHITINRDHIKNGWESLLTTINKDVLGVEIDKWFEVNQWQDLLICVWNSSSTELCDNRTMADIAESLWRHILNRLSSELKNRGRYLIVFWINPLADPIDIPGLENFLCLNPPPRFDVGHLESYIRRMFSINKIFDERIDTFIETIKKHDGDPRNTYMEFKFFLRDLQGGI